MGRSYTPTYRIEYRTNHLTMGMTAADMMSPVDGRPVNTMIWNAYRQRKRATAQNLEQWRKDYNASFQPGGVNGHIAEACGSIPHISYARIVRQSNGEMVAETTAPMFEVV